MRDIGSPLHSSSGGGHPKLALWVGGRLGSQKDGSGKKEKRNLDEQKCSCLSHFGEENEQLLITCEINEFELGARNVRACHDFLRAAKMLPREMLSQKNGVFNGNSHLDNHAIEQTQKNGKILGQVLVVKHLIHRPIWSPLSYATR